MAKFDGTNWTDLQHFKFRTCPIDDVSSIAIDGNGTKWLVIYFGGLAVFNENGTPVSVKENITSINNVILYPNPSNDKITISLPAITGNSQLSIFNVSGEKVLERQLHESETQLDISALPRGVYFVRVQSERKVEVVKMIKE